MNNNISPHFYVLSTLSTALISFFLFSRYELQGQYFFVPIFALAALYAVINFIRQCKSPGYFSIERKFAFSQLLKKSFARYVVWLIFIYIAYQFYRLEPYYSSYQFRANTSFFSQFLDLYLIFGLPYFFMTLMLKSSRVEDFYDPAVRLIHMFKQISLRIMRGDDVQSVSRVFKKKYNRKVLLNFVMRSYFIPIMIIQVYSNLFVALRLSSNEFNHYDFLTILFWLSTMLWLMDTLNASLSYSIESRWIENRTRSIDLTISGWAVCLFCYAPLNSITGSLLPFAPHVANNDPNSLIYGSVGFLYAIKIVEIIILSAHIYADVSLGPSVANITLKKLQTRGLYGIIRHPGTTLKLLFWLVQSCFYKNFWQFRFIFGYFMWGVIYVLRAFTEERHLSHFEEYRQYKKKVKYRFFPGLF